MEQLYVASLRYIRRKEPYAALRPSGFYNRSRKLFRILNGRLNHSRSANDYSFYSYKKIHCERCKHRRSERVKSRQAQLASEPFIFDFRLILPLYIPQQSFYLLCKLRLLLLEQFHSHERNQKALDSYSIRNLSIFPLIPFS